MFHSIEAGSKPGAGAGALKRPWHALFGAVAVSLALACAPAPTNAREAACAVGESVRVQDLPVQAQSTLELIARGGPFANSRDGIVFGNRERMLPRASRGYYHEYTVRTPGVRNRGARRIVCGGDAQSPDACYYSDDHYQSFKCVAR